MSCRVSTQSTESTTMGKRTPPPTISLLAHPGVSSIPPLACLRFARATRMSAPTNTTTAAETPNMNHHRPSIRLDAGPCGLREEGASAAHAGRPVEAMASAAPRDRRMDPQRGDEVGRARGTVRARPYRRSRV